MYMVHREAARVVNSSMYLTLFFLIPQQQQPSFVGGAHAKLAARRDLGIYHAGCCAAERGREYEAITCHTGFRGLSDDALHSLGSYVTLLPFV